MAVGSHAGMREAGARELIRILSNILQQLNTATGESRKIGVWIGKGPNPDPEHLGNPHWPEAFAKLARKSDCWPVLYYVHRDRREYLTTRVIEGFKVGAELGINHQGKSFSLAKTANIIVLNLFRFIEGYRGREISAGHLGIFAVGGRKITTDEHPKFRAAIQSLGRVAASLPRSCILEGVAQSGE